MGAQETPVELERHQRLAAAMEAEVETAARSTLAFQIIPVVIMCLLVGEATEVMVGPVVVVEKVALAEPEALGGTVRIARAIKVVQGLVETEALVELAAKVVLAAVGESVDQAATPVAST